jgi:hypothetical protein
MEPTTTPSSQLAAELLRSGAIAGLLVVSFVCDLLGFAWFAWCGLVLLAVAVLGGAIAAVPAEAVQDGRRARWASAIAYANLIT